MTTTIRFDSNTAGNATNDNTILLAATSVSANTLTNIAFNIIATSAAPMIIHGITVTPASASAGEIDVLQLVGTSTKDLITVGTWKFNQATSFYIPINVYIEETYTLKVKTTTGSPTCAISPHLGGL